MPIKIEAGEKVLRDERLTPIRIISTLYDRHVGGDHGLKSQVKAAMLAAQADHAEDEFVVAALRSGSTSGPVDPHKLYALVKTGKLKIAQFLECVKIEKKPLEQYLAKQDIDAISSRIRKPSPNLVTEFKASAQFGDGEKIRTAISEIISAATCMLPKAA